MQLPLAIRFSTLLLFCNCDKLAAQSVTPQALNNGGGSVIMLEWSMGESVSIAHFTGPTYNLNTGVLQPLTTIVTSINDVRSSFFGNEILVGPNPTIDKIQFKASLLRSGNLTIRVIDAKSSILQIHESGIQFGKYEKEISLEGYPSGVFYISVLFKSLIGENKSGTYKIIKL